MKLRQWVWVGQRPAGLSWVIWAGCRDGNLGTGTRYPPDTRPDGYGDDFLPTGGTRTRPDPNRDGYRMNIFSHPRVTRQVPDTSLLL
jgi:hypothetical protein